MVYGLFALTMIAVVIRSRSHDPGLVEKNYYQLDLNYQEHFEKKQNAARLQHPLTVRFEAATQLIRLQFPAELGAPSGSIKCYRASTTRDDQRLDIRADQSGQMSIPAEKMTPGIWQLEVDWQANGAKYFNATTVTVIRA